MRSMYRDDASHRRLGSPTANPTRPPNFSNVGMLGSRRREPNLRARCHPLSPMIQEPTLSASEAAAELGVSLATLYAYVSRGMVRSIAEPGRRQRRYAAADIRRLARKSEPET